MFCFSLFHITYSTIIKKWRGAGCFVFVYITKIYCPLERWRASWQRLNNKNTGCKLHPLIKKPKSSALLMDKFTTAYKIPETKTEMK